MRGISLTTALFLWLAACEPETPSSRAPLLYPALRPMAPPPDAVAARVQAVYDGDTLTLDGGKRVRLLGVDTPEIKERHKFAEDARDFTRLLCEGRDVRLEFDVEKEDRYGRWLCYVYARDRDTVAMVNAELLRAGLARFYTPGPNLRHAELLLACQREARENSRGTWKDYVLAAPRPVVATRTGRAYHRPGCKFVEESKNLRQLTDKQATEEGLSPCRECKP